MSILVIPSIDIKNGKTVRIVQGIPDLGCKSYGSDPVDMAMIWRAENAKCIHVVDFDCSHEHSHKNFDIIRNICSSVIIPVEFGGGISGYDDAKEAIDLGVFRLVIGTLAYLNRKEFIKILEAFGPQKITAAIDVVDEELVIQGRNVKTGMSAVEYSKILADIGVERFIVTDVKTNGMLNGPNIPLSLKIADATKHKVTLSGGISSYIDLKKVQDHSKY
jgi:phosphoribosylformimino-5-aminoimidazole carboxamide ribotide isomerase